MNRTTIDSETSSSNGGSAPVAITTGIIREASTVMKAATMNFSSRSRSILDQKLGAARETVTAALRWGRPVLQRDW